jgi:AcrR family transcriptional regulator
MPKVTFFNLDPEKRQAVVEASVKEFAEHPYEQASLSRIVENCGIAKGSMYQYFEDKLDLYLYIVDLAYEQKRTYVSQAFSLDADIFTVLDEYYRQSYLFAKDFPLLHQVANNFWDSRVLLPQIEEGRIDRSRDFLKFLEVAIASGAVNPNLDPQAVFFVYHAVGKDLVDHFEQGANDEYIGQVLDVLRYGLQVRKED